MVYQQPHPPNCDFVHPTEGEYPLMEQQEKQDSYAELISFITLE